MTDDPSQSASAGGGRFIGRFTRSDGLRGWLQARSNRHPYYGHGTLEVGPEAVTLRGWQRTWLGVEEAAESAFTPAQLRNAARSGALVRFEARIGRRWRVVEFTLQDEHAAGELLSALPTTRTARFDEQWAGLQEFHRLVSAGAARRWVTPALLAANVVAFVAMLVQSEGVRIDPLEMARWANAGLVTTQGEWWRLLSAAFLHWNFAHIVLNMWTLWHAGRLTERLYGSAPFLGIYLAAGILGNLASTAWNPAVVTAGASGAVFGVLGAFLAYLLREHGLPAEVVRAHRWSTLVFVLLNLVIGAVSPGVDNAAHLGGLATGFTLGWLLARPLALDRREALGTVRVAAVLCGVAAILGVGTQLMRAPPPEPDGPYAWLQQSSWYVAGEAAHWRRANRLDFALASGQISPSEYARAIREELLPFLDDATARLQGDHEPAGAQPRPPFRELVRRFVAARRAWLDTLAGSIESSASDDTAEAARLSAELERARASLDLSRLREQFNGRPQGLRVTLLKQYWSWRVADPAKCIGPHPDLHRAAATTDDPRDGPRRRQAAGCEAQRRLLMGEHGELERRVAAALLDLEDLPDGSATYSGILRGINDLTEFGGVPPEVLLAGYADWRRAHADSVLPDLLEAALYQSAAWAVRGHGFASSVRGPDWALFNYRVLLARTILDDVAARSREQPAWYSTWISVALDGSESVEAMRAAFDEGARRFPAYQPIYSAMLRVLMPRWRGSSKQVAEFVDEATQGQPDVMYARLYAAYARLEGDDVDIFKGGRASWARIRSGFEQLRIRHPASDYVLNSYAYMACRRGDRQTYMSLREAVGVRPSWTAWTHALSPQTCDERFEKEADAGTSDPMAPVGRHIDARGNVLTDTEAAWVRRQTAAALAAAEPVRTAISRHFEQHGKLPSDAVLREAPEFKPARSMGIAVTIGFGSSIDMRLVGGPLDGHKFSWTPVEHGGEISWSCAQETVPEEYLGPPCR